MSYITSDNVEAGGLTREGACGFLYRSDGMVVSFTGNAADGGACGQKNYTPQGVIATLVLALAALWSGHIRDRADCGGMQSKVERSSIRMTVSELRVHAMEALCVTTDYRHCYMWISFTVVRLLCESNIRLIFTEHLAVA
jgi:hypothetical protein